MSTQELLLAIRSLCSMAMCLLCTKRLCLSLLKVDCTGLSREGCFERVKAFCCSAKEDVCFMVVVQSDKLKAKEEDAFAGAARESKLESEQMAGKSSRKRKETSARCAEAKGQRSLTMGRV